jgi:hypothetical protein
VKAAKPPRTIFEATVNCRHCDSDAVFRPRPKGSAFALRTHSPEAHGFDESILGHPRAIIQHGQKGLSICPGKTNIDLPGTGGYAVVH